MQDATKIFRCVFNKATICCLMQATMVGIKTIGWHVAAFIPLFPQTRNFFAMVQNKLHWAITDKTAAEIIYTEADASTTS